MTLFKIFQNYFSKLFKISFIVQKNDIISQRNSQTFMTFESDLNDINDKLTSMTSFHQWHLWIYYHYWLNIYLITILFINDINWHQFQTPLIISDTFDNIRQFNDIFECYERIFFWLHILTSSLHLHILFIFFSLHIHWIYNSIYIIQGQKNLIRNT